MQPNYIAKKSVWGVISFWGIVSCILIIPIFVLIYRIFSARSNRIEFYDDHIITYSGLLTKNKKQSVFMGVTSTSVKKTFFGQIFNYGDVNIDCVGDKWDIDTHAIKDPDALESYLQSKIIKSPVSNQFVHI